MIQCREIEKFGNVYCHSFTLPFTNNPIPGVYPINLCTFIHVVAVAKTKDEKKPKCVGQNLKVLFQNNTYCHFH